MPDSKQKLVDIYSADDIKGLTTIAGTVIYGILGDVIPQNEKEAFVKQKIFMK
ncbi:MAG: hypothetical protein J6P57_08710 [Lachnospiraceae bacterium]|nr:hypothetical protein [Lachnospiraceae bacterium]